MAGRCRSPGDQGKFTLLKLNLTGLLLGLSSAHIELGKRSPSQVRVLPPFARALELRQNIYLVKVLAIRDTSEEFMVARRDTLKRGLGAAGGQLPKLEEDNVMREFLSVRSTSISSSYT